MAKPLIIIGSGLAGYMTAKEWRKYDTSTPLIILTADNGHFYSKPMLSNSFRMSKSPKQLITSSVENMAEQLDADIKTHCQVLNIDSEQQTVVTEQATFEYSQLVIACGASPRHLTIDGDASDSVMTVNNLEQYNQFRSQINNAKHITIMGTGLVGCEFANDLRHHGYDITMISPDEHLLQRFIPQTVAQHVLKSLQDFGVCCHLQTTIHSLNRNQNQRIQVNTSQADITFETDAILSAAGLIPNIHLAQTAGIQYSQSIAVNHFLETSMENIFALGDCVAYDNQPKMYVAPILHGARALAKTLTGERTAITLAALPIKVKTSVCPLVILPPNDNNTAQWHEECNNHHEGIILSYDDKQHLNGFILWGKATAQQAKWLKALNNPISATE